MRAAHYDRLSRWYDALAGPSEARYRRRALAALAAAPGERVLEIGHGTGHALVALAAAVGSSGLACGIDLSAGMTRVAAKRVARQRPAAEAGLALGDALALPFGENTFDAVFMSFTLELFAADGIDRVLAECRRVLRREGRLGVAALRLPERPTLMTRLYAWAGRRFPAWVDCRPIAVAETLAGHGFFPVHVAHGTLWGLPVAVAVAAAPGPSSGAPGRGRAGR